MTESQPTQRRGVTRPSRRKRFVLSLLGAAAAFVIVFEFLALQLQGAGTLTTGGGTGPAQATSVRAPAGTPVTTRASGGITTGGTTTATAPAASRPISAHPRRSHGITTRASGTAISSRGEGDDL